MIFERSDGEAGVAISWNPVRTRVDGSDYTAEQHYGYELGVSDPAKPNDGFTPKISFPTAFDTASWPLADLDIDEPGTYEIALRTVDKSGQESAWSSPLVFTARFAAPSAPTGLRVL